MVEKVVIGGCNTYRSDKIKEFIIKSLEEINLLLAYFD